MFFDPLYQFFLFDFAQPEDRLYWPVILINLALAWIYFVPNGIGKSWAMIRNNLLSKKNTAAPFGNF